MLKVENLKQNELRNSSRIEVLWRNKIVHSVDWSTGFVRTWNKNHNESTLATHLIEEFEEKIIKNQDQDQRLKMSSDSGTNHGKDQST
jgi:hypothetical protein